MKINPEQLLELKSIALAIFSVGLTYYFMGELGLFVLIPLTLLATFYHDNYTYRREQEEARLRRDATLDLEDEEDE